MMMVRMAKGSCGTCGRGGSLDFGSFFVVAASSFSRGSLGYMNVISSNITIKNKTKQDL